MRGDRVKALREAAGLTQQGLAVLLGYASKVSISRIESGERDLSTDKLKQLASILNTSVDYLLGSTDDSRRIYKGDSFDTPEAFWNAWEADSVFDEKLLTAYHTAPEKDRTAVRIILDIDENGDKKDGSI